jgi:hypothetical protein
MRKTMFLTGHQRALNDPAIFRTRVNAACDEQELLLRKLLGSAPKLIGSAKSRDIVGMLETGEANDPVQPVGGAHAVPQVKPLNTLYLLTTASQMPQSGRPHAADANHNGVEGLHVWFPGQVMLDCDL